MQAEDISCKKRLELCRGVGAKCERARTYEISCERSHFPLRRALGRGLYRRFAAAVSAPV